MINTGASGVTSYIATYATHEQAFQWTKATATHYDKISIIFFATATMQDQGSQLRIRF